MTGYTVYNYHSGAVKGRGLSVEQAAEIVLTYDGARYEVRREPVRYDFNDQSAWQLYVARPGSRDYFLCWDGPSPHGRLIRDYAASEAEAWAKLAPMVLTADWPHPFGCVTDEEYDAMQAEIAAEQEG